MLLILTVLHCTQQCFECMECSAQLLEVVMDLGRPPFARFVTGDVLLSEEPVSSEQLDYAIEQVLSC